MTQQTARYPIQRVDSRPVEGPDQGGPSASQEGPTQHGRERLVEVHHVRPLIIDSPCCRACGSQREGECRLRPIRRHGVHLTDVQLRDPMVGHLPCTLTTRRDQREAMSPSGQLHRQSPGLLLHTAGHPKAVGRDHGDAELLAHDDASSTKASEKTCHCSGCWRINPLS